MNNRLIEIAVVIVAALVLSACGGSNGRSVTQSKLQSNDNSHPQSSTQWSQVSFSSPLLQISSPYSLLASSASIDSQIFSSRSSISSSKFNSVSNQKSSDFSQSAYSSSSTSVLGSLPSVTMSSESNSAFTSSAQFTSASNISSAASSSVFASISFQRTLPVLHVATDNHQPVIIKSEYLTAQFQLENSQGVVLSSGALEIRGRGNTTWDMPKKPYRLKLQDKQSLLEMPSNRHWVLLANYADKTLLRNDVAFLRVTL